MLKNNILPYPSEKQFSLGIGPSQTVERFPIRSFVFATGKLATKFILDCLQDFSISIYNIESQNAPAMFACNSDIDAPFTVEESS